MNWKILAVGALVVVPLLMILASGFGNDPHAIPFLLNGKSAPDFALKNLDHETVSLAALKGKPVVINFWSTWCEPCKTEHETLQRGSVAFGDRVQFLGVIYQDDAGAAQQYLASRSNHYPQLIDPKSLVALDYGVSGVPETYFIDANGRVHHKTAGAVTPGLLIQAVNGMLEGVAQ